MVLGGTTYGSQGAVVFLFLVTLSSLFTSHANAQNPIRYCQFLLTRLDRDQSDYKVRYIADGTLVRREVKYLLPKGRPPVGGWPAVLMFQGSLSPIKFERPPQDVMGIKYETQLAQDLLKQGFAVIAPIALGGLGWQTNLPVASQAYWLTSDYYLFKNLFHELDHGKLGPINSKVLFATGISSGGYNTSRMGITFPERFRALAIQAASYATCMGPICSIPDRLSKDHPPTLLIAGARDQLVPLKTTQSYHERLLQNQIETALHVNPMGEHGWFAESPQLIVNWFKENIP